MSTWAHHDGSALHVNSPSSKDLSLEDLSFKDRSFKAAQPGPAGAPATVPPHRADRVRLRAHTTLSSVDIRVVVDGEPRYIPASTSDGTWWEATLPPVTHYRFLLRRTGPAGGPARRWLTGIGESTHDLPDIHDFRLGTDDPPPDWATDAVVYQIFPDRFARSGRSWPRPSWAVDDPEDISHWYYGGDLDGITAHLDHIAAVGANTVYLTPIFPADSNHRYDAASFDHVDPALGGDPALRRLGDAVHARGMRLIGDLTTNHSGVTHPWTSDDPALYHRNADGTLETWLGIPSLPKLDWTNPRLRKHFAGIIARWLEIFDGWRIDVANMTGRLRDVDVTHDVARFVRRAAVGARPDALLIAEHAHDFTQDLDRAGWHGTMNYAGFTRPIWSWLADNDLPTFLGVPGRIEPGTAPAMVATMRAFASLVSWCSWTHSWSLLSSHDTARIRTVVGSPERHEVAVGLLCTLPGTPMIFAGDELGLTGVTGEDSRTPMPWTPTPPVLPVYPALLGLRATTPALRHGGLRWLHEDDDTILYARETADDTILVLARRAPGKPVPFPYEAENLYGGWSPRSGMLAGDGPTVQVWRQTDREVPPPW